MICLHPFFPVPARRVRSFPALAAACLLAAFALGGVPVPAARAQEVSATAALTDTNAEPGQPVTYQIQLSGGQADRPPAAPRVEGLIITYAGESQSVQMSNVSGGGFRFASTYTYNYTIETDRPGRYVIPGQEVAVGRKLVRVQAVELTVGDGSGGGPGGNTQGGAPPRNSSTAAFLRLVLPKKSAYVGESIPVEVRCYLGLRLRADAPLGVSVEGEGFSTQKFAPAQTDTEVIDGVQYNVISTKSSITPLKAGEITLGPALVEIVIQRPRRRSNDPFDQFFGDPFQSAMVARQERLRGDSQKFEVKPLPDGRPDDFEGAIGQFRLEAAARGNPRKVQTGEPVTLVASLQGTGNFDRIGAPELSEQTDLQTYPANSRFKGEDDVHSRGTKTFEQVVIPRAARASLPGYHLSYLDPDTGKYVRLSTPPVPVKVEGAAPTPPPAAGPAVAAVASATPAASPAPAAKPEDILYIRNDPGATVGGEAFVPLFRRREFWLAQIAPLVVLAVVAVLLWRAGRIRNDRRRRAAALQRLQSELVRTLHGEKTGRRDFYTAATRLARLKASVPADVESGESLTAEEVSRARSLDPDTASSLEAIFHRYDELSYNGGRAAQEPVPAYERKDVLATVEKL